MANLRVNQFTDGASGHVNVTLTCSSGTFTFGSNLSPQSGPQDEREATRLRIMAHPADYSFKDLQISDDACIRAVDYAQRTIAAARSMPAPSYSPLCGNCVDFADLLLMHVGQSPFSIGNFLKSGSLADSYAELSRFICTTNRESLMYSTPDAPIGISDGSAVESLFQSTYERTMDWGFTGDLLQAMDALQNQIGFSINERFFTDFYDEWLANGGSPIAIDLNGDGVRTIALPDSNVNFDITGDGLAERTAWLDKNDAFLVLDRNGNGLIDNVGEMFGGLLRGEGYAELALLDEDSDGALTRMDSGFKSLALWRDENMNGRTDPGELIDMRDAGIDSLSVRYRSTSDVDHGNLIGERSEASGSTVRDMADIYFQYSRQRQHTDNRSTSDETAMANHRIVGSHVPTDTLQINHSDTAILAI